MASVQPKYNRNGKRLGWQARWIEPETRIQRSKLFNRLDQAKTFGAKMEAAKCDGTYIPPEAGQATFKAYADAWRALQDHRPGTAEQVRLNFTNHVYPRIGGRPIGAIRQGELRAMLKSLDEDLAASTVSVIWAWVGTVFKQAVVDRMISASPCIGIRRRPLPNRKATVIEAQTVADLAASITRRYRAAIIVGAGTGMRISEVLGLTVDRIDFLRRSIRVDRQLARLGGSKPTFAPLKDRENREPDIPVGEVVLDALAIHLAEYGEGPERLVFTTVYQGKVGHSTWSDHWRRASVAADLDAGRGGFHLLRHFYASALIASGASVKEVQSRLGHNSATITLDVYGHLWPGDDDRTRDASDAALSELAHTSGGAWLDPPLTPSRMSAT